MRVHRVLAYVALLRRPSRCLFVWARGHLPMKPYLKPCAAGLYVSGLLASGLEPIPTYEGEGRHAVLTSAAVKKRGGEESDGVCVRVCVWLPGPAAVTKLLAAPLLDGMACWPLKHLCFKPAPCTASPPACLPEMPVSPFLAASPDLVPPPCLV